MLGFVTLHSYDLNENPRLTSSTGEKINMGSLRKFNWHMRGTDTDKVCQNDGPFPGIKDCLAREGCAPSSGGCKLFVVDWYWFAENMELTSRSLVNCGLDAPGFAHGGVNVGLGCDGSQVKRCIDQELGISGNTDYVCNTTG